MQQKYIDTNTTTIADNALLISNRLYANTSKEESGLAVSNLNDDKLSIFMFAYAIPTNILNDTIKSDIVTSANSPMIRETFSTAILDSRGTKTSSSNFARCSVSRQKPIMCLLLDLH